MLKRRLDQAQLICTALSLLWFVLPFAEGEPSDFGGFPMAFAAGDGFFVPLLALSGLVWTGLLQRATRPGARAVLIVLSLVSALVTAAFLAASRVLLVPHWDIVPTWYVCVAGAAGVWAASLARLTVVPETGRTPASTDAERRCGSCGLGYRRSDYRADAREMRCSRCKALLAREERTDG